MTQSAPVLSPEEKRRRMIIATMRKNGYTPDALIETLHTVQNAYGYLDSAELRFVARELHLPQSLVYGVATFYHAFFLPLDPSLDISNPEDIVCVPRSTVPFCKTDSSNGRR